MGAVMSQKAHTAPVFESRFLTDTTANDQRLILILLNWHLPSDTLSFWDKAQLRICADGAANYLYDGLEDWTTSQGQTLEQKRLQYAPDVIAGDLDSIRPDVMNYYQLQGKTKILNQAEDQDSTDLHKCITYATKHIQEHPEEFPSSSITTVLGLGALGGRLDHTIGNLSTLFANTSTAADTRYSQPLHKGLHLVLMGDGSLARCIPRGRSVIRPSRAHEGPSCGFVAFAGPATVTFTGLRWNLSNARMEMGGLQSTCNIIDEDEVVVDTDAPLLWTTQLAKQP